MISCQASPSQVTLKVAVPLLTLNGKDERQFSLSASSAGKAEREGETTLWHGMRQPGTAQGIDVAIMAYYRHRPLPGVEIAR
jgi:hypothetical protein